MKKCSKKIFIILMIGQILQPTVGDCSSYFEQVGNKLVIGSSNATLAWLEIPRNIVNTSREHNVVIGITGGVLKGVLHTIGRTMSGAFDLVTFPLPSQSIVKPVYVYDNFRVETQYGPIPF